MQLTKLTDSLFFYKRRTDFLSHLYIPTKKIMKQQKTKVAATPERRNTAEASAERKA